MSSGDMSHFFEARPPSARERVLPGEVQAFVWRESAASKPFTSVCASGEIPSRPLQ
jgi:hypothetical protein